MTQLPIQTSSGQHVPFQFVDRYDREASNLARKALFAAAALVIFGFGSAIFVPISGAVIVNAQVAPESQIKRIAHPVGGIISKIYVEDGQNVTRGALLMRLDTHISAIDAELSDRSLMQLLAQRARLTAEVEGRGSVAFPTELSRRNTEGALAAISAEQLRFRLNRAEQSSLVAQLGERINQLRRQIESYEVQISALRQQQGLILPELDSVRELRSRGYVTIRRLNEMERAAVELAGSIGALQANIAQSNAAIAEANEKRIQQGQTARTLAGSELSRVEAAINSQRFASASAEDSLNRSTIRAPSAGTVDKMAYNTVGDVVRPAETILQIVPVNDRSVFEGALSVSDVDRVKIGQPARVRLSALNAATTSELTGKVVFVSADPVKDEKTAARFYRVRVALSEKDAALAKEYSLISGMPAELFIETGSRSFLSYATKPLRDQFARAFRN